jgi:hypothetical protein
LGYTLRSGGAKGADQAFERGASKKDIFYSKDATEKTLKIAEEIHPNWKAVKGANDKATKFIQGLMARNTNQVFGRELDVPVDFVLAWTPDGITHYSNRTIKTGGTGQAIDMASRKGIPVINMAKTDWREQLMAVLAEIGVKEAPVTRAMFASKEGIVISYPKTINIDVEGYDYQFDTNKLKEIRKVFDPDEEDNTITDGRKFKTDDGERFLEEYGMTDKQYEYALKNEQVLADLVHTGQWGWSDENIEYETISKAIDRLLADNAIITDINQGVLFNEFEEIQEFTPERRKEILSNFASKYDITEQQALNYINEALLRDRENVINKLKECF